MRGEPVASAGIKGMRARSGGSTVEAIAPGGVRDRHGKGLGGGGDVPLRRAYRRNAASVIKEQAIRRPNGR